MSKKLGPMRVIPVKGANVYGKPISNFPRKRNSKGVYLTEVGTDNAKELIYSRLKLQPDTHNRVPGAIHFPMDDSVCDDTELQQLTAERKVAERRNGVTVYRWSAGGRRNEALDCLVYAMAALDIAKTRMGIDLQKLSRDFMPVTDEAEPEQPKPKKQKQQSSNSWLGTSGGGWL
jgi:phage terminase large subunit GpA-like protein